MNVTTWKVGVQERDPDDTAGPKMLQISAMEDGGPDADLDCTDVVTIGLCDGDDEEEALIDVSRKSLKSFCERVLFQLEADKKLRGE